MGARMACCPGDDMTLGEEKKTDQTLTKLAQSEANQHARAA